METRPPVLDVRTMPKMLFLGSGGKIWFIFSLSLSLTVTLTVSLLPVSVKYMYPFHRTPWENVFKISIWKRKWRALRWKRKHNTFASLLPLFQNNAHLLSFAIFFFLDCFLQGICTIFTMLSIPQNLLLLAPEEFRFIQASLHVNCLGEIFKSGMPSPLILLS